MFPYEISAIISENKQTKDATNKAFENKILKIKRIVAVDNCFLVSYKKIDNIKLLITIQNNSPISI